MLGGSDRRNRPIKAPLRSLGWILTLALGAACPGLSAEAAGPADASPAVRPGAADTWIVAAGGGANILGRWILKPRTRDVPPEGLDPADISIGWDRRALSIPNDDASAVSNLFLAGAVFSPYLGTLAGGDPHAWNTRFHLGMLQAESALVGMGATHLLKVAFSRPRPYAYGPASELPDTPSYDSDTRRTFQSFPSGHAALAWSSTMAGITFMARSRPDLPSWVHFVGGMAAGGMAAATSLLRVDATQHFPTDVAGGCLIGGAVGTGLVVLRVPAREGTSHAFVTGLAGVAVGTVLAFLLTPPTSPWIE
jgi:hypothetical protein